MKQLTFLVIFVGLVFQAGCNRVPDPQSAARGVEATNNVVGAQRVDTLRSWGNGAPRLLVRVPKEFTLSDQKGPDFDVFRYATGDSTSQWFGATMGFYIGHAPSEFSGQLSGSIAVTKWRGDRFVWQSWQETRAGRTSLHCESVIRDLFRDVPRSVDQGGVRQLLVHVFIRADNDTRLHALTHVAESLQLLAPP